MTTTQDSGPIAPANGRAIHSGFVTAAMCSSVLLIIASVSGLNMALPLVGRELGASQSEVQWIVDIFALVLAALLLPAGAIGDRFGRRRVMLTGFAVFVAAGIWATLADTVTQLFIARGLGGLGAALIFPGTLSTLTGALPAEQRSRAIGLWVASASMGGTVGSIAAGALTEEFWYGSIFLAFTIVGAATGLAVLAYVPETSDPEHANLDPVGSVLSLVGIGGLVLAVTEGPVKGWTEPITVAGFAAAAVGLVGFITYEMRTTRPMLDVRLFGLRRFRTGSLSIFVQFLAIFGFFFTAAQYLAFVAGYSPLEVALAFLPLAPCVPLVSTRSAHWSRRFGPGRIGGIGLGLMAAGFAVIAAFVDADSPYWVLAVGLVLFGLGLGMASPPATEAIIEALPPAKQGVASAVNDLARELGGALGIAILGSALTAGYRSTIDDNVASVPVESVDAVRDSAAVGFELAADAGSNGASMVATMRSALVDGFSLSMWVAAAALALSAAYVWVRTPSEPSAPSSEGLLLTTN